MLRCSATLMSYDLRSTQLKARWIVTGALLNGRMLGPFLVRWPLKISPSGGVLSAVLRVEPSAKHLRATECVRPCAELAESSSPKGLVFLRNYSPELDGGGEAIAAKNCGIQLWMW